MTLELKTKLPNSDTIFFDEFDECDEPTVHPKDLYQWAINGGDYNAWDTPGIISKLEKYKTEQTFDYVVFDAPFGRAHEDSGRFIDLMVYIDTPLDVAMARRLIRDYSSQSNDSPHKILNNLERDLTHYLEKTRLPYLEMAKSVKPNSDIILDGCLTPELLADKIIEKINEEQNAAGNTHFSRSPV